MNKKISILDALRYAATTFWKNVQLLLAAEFAILILLGLCLLGYAIVFGAIGLLVTSYYGGISIVYADFLAADSIWFFDFIINHKLLCCILGIGGIGMLINILILFVTLDLGLDKIQLDLYDNKKTSFRSLFSCFNLWRSSSKAFILLMLCYFTLLLIFFSLFFLLLSLGFYNEVLTQESAIWFLSQFMILIVGLPVFLTARFFLYPYLIIEKHLGAVDSLVSSWSLAKGSTIPLFIIYCMFWGSEQLGELVLGNLISLLTLNVFLRCYLSLAFCYIYRQVSPAPTHSEQLID